MRRYDSAGCGVCEVLLPREGIDLQKWAVVACDQFTSQPDYWSEVEQLVGDAPSTLNMIFPEVYLNEPHADRRITAIRSFMQQYVDSGVLAPHDGLIYVERKISNLSDKVRRGLMLCLDLEQYDYRPGSSSLIRATEGTIIDRLPPRIKIREGASLELPHIMVLVDDPEDEVIGNLARRRDQLTPLYNVELMAGSGHASGFRVDDRSLEEATMAALEALGERDAFSRKYDLSGEDNPVLLYAMGDGNHSLATAKAIWERIKEGAENPAVVMDDSARYALVEVVNVYDEALVFEPIHRVLFEVEGGGARLIDEMERVFGDRFEATRVESLEAMQGLVDEVEAGKHRVGVVLDSGFSVVTVRSPAANLAVGTLQSVLDPFMVDGGSSEVDYVHGTQALCELGAKPGNIGFYLPSMSKHDLFKSVILDGALPRKTFSMGEAEEKRFYLECRKLG